MTKHGFVFFVLTITTISPAYAYLDPGTGSLIIQGLLAGIAMALLTIKMYWRKLMHIFNSIWRINKLKTTKQKK